MNKLPPYDHDECPVTHCTYPPPSPQDTPRTDAEVLRALECCKDDSERFAALSNFARTLERELNAAKLSIELQERGKYGRIDLQTQLDAAKAEIERLRKHIRALTDEPD